MIMKTSDRKHPGPLCYDTKNKVVVGPHYSLELLEAIVSHYFSKQIKGLIKIGTQNPKAVFLCHKSEKDIRGHHIMLKIWAQDSRTVFSELIWAFDSSSYKVSKFIKTYKLSLLGLDSKCLKYYKIQFIERKVCYTSKCSIITPGMLHQSYLWIKIE